jgi:hypothetical protein
MLAQQQTLKGEEEVIKRVVIILKINHIIIKFINSLERTEDGKLGYDYG